MSTIAELSAETFDAAVLQADKPYLVDFWAPWCGPCRALAPIIEQIAEEYADKIYVGKLNIDDARGLAERYRIMSIPSVILFKDGKPAAVSVGLAPKEELVKRFNSFL